MRVLKELTQWFEAQRAQATDDFALGANLFAQMLRDTERVEVSIDRLEKIGREDVDRNLRALRQACASFSQKTIQECIAAVQTDKPKNGAVDGARQQLPELKRFVRAKGVVTIPGPEEAEVAESPLIIAGVLPISISRVPSIRGCQPSTMSPHRIPRGPERNARHTSRVRPPFYSSRSTRYGQGISCSLCTRAACSLSSGNCS